MKTWIQCVGFATVVLIAGCASQPPQTDPDSAAAPGDRVIAEITTVDRITLLEPSSVSVDFNGNLIVADPALGRLVRIDGDHGSALEFQQPSQATSFYPADVKLSGFFVYALDTPGRLLLRFDESGAYRDVLIDFDQAFSGRRISPTGLDVDDSGRIAVSDAKNHQVILFDSYLQIELEFGNYGTHPGQFDSPEGVSFARDGGVVVCDTGNRRLQSFDDAGTYRRSMPSSSGPNPLRRPRRAAIDSAGNIYVADPGAKRVFVFDADGRLTREIVPAGKRDFRPMDVVVTPSGLIYVADAALGGLYSFR
jgi:DNA-binding beta-propeller fold protein YncE